MRHKYLKPKTKEELEKTSEIERAMFAIKASTLHLFEEFIFMPLTNECFGLAKKFMEDELASSKYGWLCLDSKDYTIKCDEENNPPETIASGKVHLTVRWKNEMAMDVWL